jgi:hypothetical protein
MSVVENGVIRQLSISQIETFDHTQTGGCERKWWFERPMELRPDQNKDQAEGEAGHALLATYLTTGEIPKGRKLMGKAVTGAIVKGELPKPGADLLVETRFDGQPKHGPNGEWLPLDVAETLHLAGVPLDGFIDLAFRRGDTPEIWDHKFFRPARPELSPDPYVWLKKPSELIKTVQLPVYVLSQIPYWPDAKNWRIAHHYVSKVGVDSLIRAATVSTAEVLERKAEIETVIERMKLVSRATDQRDVPHNRKSCDAYKGCPHQSICAAFKEKPKMDLTPEELAMFDGIPMSDEVAAPAPEAPPAPPVVAPAPPKKPRAGLIHESSEADPVPPTPSPVTDAETRTCACGTPITAENGSRLQSGTWKHIGCKLDAPPAEPPKPRTRKAAPAAPAAPVVTPLAAPAYAGERDSDRAAQAALNAVLAARAPVDPPKEPIATPAPVAHADSPVKTVSMIGLPPVAAIDLPASGESRIILANLFENVAALLRKI